MKTNTVNYVVHVREPNVVLKVASPASSNNFEYMVCEGFDGRQTIIVQGSPQHFIPIRKNDNVLK